MATCGYCKQTGQTVAHVRICGIGTDVHRAVETLARPLPDLEPGMVFTIDLAEGYWLTEAMLVDDKVQARRMDPTGTVVVWPLCQVEMVFPNAQAATDYRIAVAQQATKRRNAEVLHGDPNYCRGCAKGWAGAKWHRSDCPVVAARDAQAAKLVPPTTDATNVWSPVNELRNAVKEHLHYENKLGGRHKREGRFAVVVDGTTKFLRIKLMLNGNYAGRVFVDSQASDDYFPVKAPATLTAYLTAVLADPTAAAKLYADELGVCSRCGRTLTNDESRTWGIGPECRSK
jgi:hypothetical protein